MSLIGLSNLGNTCFINSTLQCLFNTPELTVFLNQATYKQRLTNTPDSVILSEYDELRKMAQTNSRGVLTPGKFLSAVHRVARQKHQEIFTGFIQNDLPEFILFMIDCFNNAIKRPVAISYQGTPQNDKDKLAIACYAVIKRMYEKEYSEIINMFYGIHVSLITSDDGQLLSTSPEPFFILSLPIPISNPSPTIYDCFNLYTTVEHMVGENQYMKDDATREMVDATKCIKFWSLPNILIIDLKRCVISEDGSKLRKYVGTVHFSPSDLLNLSNYVVGYNAASYMYELYGVCNHIGNMLMNGHYTAFIKGIGGKWRHFNDGQVTEIQEADVVTNNAYCLFYRKRTATN